MLAGRSVRHRVGIHQVGDLILNITQNLDDIHVPKFRKRRDEVGVLQKLQHELRISSN